MSRWKCAVSYLTLTLVLGACTNLNIRPVSRPMAPAPLPQYKVGDKFVFKVAIVEDAHEVVAVNSKSITIKSPVFGTLTQPRDFSNPENRTGGITQAYTARQDQALSGLFPLKVGNRVSGTGSFTYNSKGTYARSCTVDKQVRVTVPAGNFDTYQIECVMNYTVPSGTNLESDRIWYAPKINRWVAIIRHGRMFVLQSYEKK